jgi:hypothetical protein
MATVAMAWTTVALQIMAELNVANTGAGYASWRGISARETSIAVALLETVKYQTVWTEHVGSAGKMEWFVKRIKTAARITARLGPASRSRATRTEAALIAGSGIVLVAGECAPALLAGECAPALLAGSANALLATDQSELFYRKVCIWATSNR